MGSTKLKVAVALSVLIVSAIGASRASALEAEWAIEAEGFSALKLKEEKLGGSGGSLSLVLPAFGITVKCLESAESGKAREGGSTEITVTLTKCEVVKLPACKVSEPLVMDAKASLIATGGNYYDKFEALKAGKPLMTVVLKGEECPLVEKNEVTGAIVAVISLQEMREQPVAFIESTSKKVNESLKAEKKPELSLKFGAQTAFLSGEFRVSVQGGENLGKEFLVGPKTKLCKVAPLQDDSCPAMQNYATGTAITFTNNVNFKFVYAGLEPSCEIGVLKGTTTATIGSPWLNGTLTTFKFENCSGGCSAEGLGTWKARFFATGEGGGLMYLHGQYFKFFCAGKTCAYFGDAGSFLVGATPNANFTSAGGSLWKDEMGSEEICSLFGSWEAVKGAGYLSFKVEAPAPLWLAS